MQTFASLLRSCVFLGLSTGSLGQSVPASALEELRVEFHKMNEVLRNEFRVELADVQTKLEDVLAVFQTQPRRTNEDFSCMREDMDSGDIYFDGCNVHVRSGGGNTDATPNGKGNVIIGYNKPRGSLMEVLESAEGLEDTEAKKVEAGELDVSVSRGGSHNLVIGDRLEYTSFGGIVTGYNNEILNEYSAVVGGYRNKAIGEYSTVTGGSFNEASGYGSSISGGYGNTATGSYSSISGGTGNTASGRYSSVLGGDSNDAQGEAAVVTGGLKNKAIGDRASVVGGRKNKAKRYFSVVTGA